MSSGVVPPTGGLPIGAVVMRDKVAAAMALGDHGSTFAGNPLVAQVGRRHLRGQVLAWYAQPLALCQNLVPYVVYRLRCQSPTWAHLE